ncbi:MAG: Co2+/Mg2+ efflux protein ApaG [Flavobacteriales bacterium]|nr:Co2+/Mg2+ efflux protein ApaG [Flavobacteriales bacterium]
MVSQITRGIKISVLTFFEDSFYANQKLQYAFCYEITIENQSNSIVQLTSRHWEIFDALDTSKIVEGEGVVGKKPILQIGEKYTYRSGCLLSSPHGAMNGYFNMIDFNSSNRFSVIVPTFKLNSPFALN